MGLDSFREVLCSLDHQTRLFKDFFLHQRSSDGSLSHEEDLAKVIELQDIIDKQSKEQSQMKERLAALSSHVAELEEDLDTARKDLIKSEEVNTKLQRDVREVSDSRRCRAVVELNVGCLVGPLCVDIYPLQSPALCIYSSSGSRFILVHM